MYWLYYIGMNYINEQSFRCLLGQRSEDVEIVDNLFFWKVNGKKHFGVEGELTANNISNLKNFAPSNFHYMSQSNLDILSNCFTVKKSREKSIILDIQDLNFVGNNNVRHCLNRAKKENFIIENNFRKIEDVKALIKNWSDNYSEKYFRNNSGKNLFFYKNNFHNNCISAFIYKNDDLVAFGSLSKPKDGYSSYILGKALYKNYYGLSEFADVELYKLGQTQGVKFCNMGGGTTKNLFNYKKKFKYQEVLHYDGSIK